MKEERRERLRVGLLRIFTTPDFRIVSKQKQIMSEMPEHDLFWEKELEIIKEKDAGSNIPSWATPCYSKPLLTKEQEYHLFRKFNFLKYSSLKQLQTRHLSKAEDKFSEAQKIKNLIAECNFRWGFNLVKKVDKSVNDEDRVALAYESILKAVDYFDYRRDLKFSTYSNYVVKRELYRDWQNKVKHEERYRCITDDVLTSLTGEQSDISDVNERNNIAANKVLNFCMEALDDRELKIIRGRFGFDDFKTLSGLGNELGVTKERVRQIEGKALAKLSDYKGSLKRFL